MPSTLNFGVFSDGLPEKKLQLVFTSSLTNPIKPLGRGVTTRFHRESGSNGGVVPKRTLQLTNTTLYSFFCPPDQTAFGQHASLHTSITILMSPSVFNYMSQTSQTVFTANAQKLSYRHACEQQPSSRLLFKAT
jgi:hypothetical protein